MTEFRVTFESGYETTARIDRETATSHEYWVEITQRQNPYDAGDQPCAVDGVPLDEDGQWMQYVDKRLCEQMGIAPTELYS